MFDDIKKFYKDNKIAILVVTGCVLAMLLIWLAR